MYKDDLTDEELIWQMYYRDGLSEEYIAREMNMTPIVVKSIINYQMKQNDEMEVITEEDREKYLYSNKWLEDLADLFGDKDCIEEDEEDEEDEPVGDSHLDRLRLINKYVAKNDYGRLSRIMKEDMRLHKIEMDKIRKKNKKK